MSKINDILEANREFVELVSEIPLVDEVRIFADEILVEYWRNMNNTRFEGEKIPLFHMVKIFNKIDEIFSS